DILFGLRNPSGKLPMTFGNTEREAAYATTEQFPGVLVDPPHWLNRKRLLARYTEGLQVGYRWYEANAVTPVFPFGFGLSYTTFVYSDLLVTSTHEGGCPGVPPGLNWVCVNGGWVPPDHPLAIGALVLPVLTVTYTITNTGNRQGAEASQVYLTLPAEAGQPSKRLVGFQKVDLMPGGSQRVTVTIDSSASNH